MDDTRQAFTRRGYPERKTCADCGTVYYSAGAHLERCPGLADEADALAARLSGLQEAVRHVIADSPGTPDSVKKYLAAALNGEPS